MQWYGRAEGGGVMMCMVPALRRMGQVYFDRAQKGETYVPHLTIYGPS